MRKSKFRLHQSKHSYSGSLKGDDEGEVVKERLAGPAISVVFHLVALLFFGSTIVFKAPPERADLDVVMMDDIARAAKKIPEKISLPGETTGVKGVVTKQDKPNLDKIKDFKLDVQKEEAFKKPSPEPLSDLSMTVGGSKALSVDKMDVYANRTKKGRQAALDFYTAWEVEPLVEKGLDWLAENQNPDFSWGRGRYKDALTGMATLAFLGRGETPSSRRYGRAVAGGLRRIVEYSDAKGEAGGDSYTNAIHAIVLAEAYALTKMPVLKPTLEKRIKTIVDEINESGSYAYRRDRSRDSAAGALITVAQDGPRCDLSVTACNVQALRAAVAADCKVPGVMQCLMSAVETGVKKTHSCPEGGFSFLANKDGSLKRGDQTMSAIGSFCLQLFDEGNSPEAKAAFRLMLSAENGSWLACDWKKASPWALFTWYYQNQVMFNATLGKGPFWKEWSASCLRSLRDNQERDGSWLSPSQKFGGYKPDDYAFAEIDKLFGSEHDLRVYGTSLCVLMLEVYYRHVPGRSLVSGMKGRAAQTDDDIKIKLD